MDAYIQVLLLRDSRTEGFLAAFNSGVGQNIASHASPTAKHSAFLILPSRFIHFHFLQIPLNRKMTCLTALNFIFFAYEIMDLSLSLSLKFIPGKFKATERQHTRELISA